jgi:uroporphyrin-III C-methyltransferase/precorrin-2 dehydrogenase/sirohydrochlorin ferrochelatase
VFAPEPGEEMLTLAAEPPHGPIAVHRRAWTAQDFTAAAIAVGACENEAEASHFARAARDAGVPVNVVDRPKFSDFTFGAIVNRSPLVIGISTDGAAPVFSQAIRAKLEALIPRGFARWAAAAQRWRAAVQSSGLPFNGRRRFWQHFTERALREPEAHPQSSDYDLLLNATKAEAELVKAGSVTLVGAGPGDPELLTLRAVRALQSADVILYDDRVSPAILDFARREAKKLLVGKTGRGQSEINDLMTGIAKSGHRVVVLKAGNPLIVGEAGEEAAACRKAGLPLTVVPGIVAAEGRRRTVDIASHVFMGTR